MKAKSKRDLRKLESLILGCWALFSILTIEVWAADLSTLLSLNAGAAKVIDSIDNMTMEEMTEIATLDDEEEAKEAEKYNMVMANVNEYLNVRKEPDSNSEKIGYLYADCGGTILERTNGWTKIESGNLVGWAKDDYLIFGEDAHNLAQEVGVLEAKVEVNGLRMRKEANTDCGVWTSLEKGEVFQAVKEHTTEEWIAVEYEGDLGFISADYVSLNFTIDHGETLEDIKEREKRERREKQKLIAEEGPETIGTTDEMLLAALIQCEAANQPYEGQVAVGAVVMNRVKCEAYPDTIAGVIYASGQFTPAKTGKVEKLALKGVKESCLQAARAAMAGETTVGDAMHFRRVGKRDGIIIGDHVFW